MQKTLIAAVICCSLLGHPGLLFSQDTAVPQSQAAWEAVAAAANNGNFHQALALCQRLAGKGDVRGWLNQAIIFKDIGSPRNAILVLQKALRRSAQNDTVLLLLARLYYLDSQPDRAIPVLEELVRRDAHNQEALITLGLCFQDKQDDRRAQEYYAKAIEVNKDNVLAHLSLADLYYRRNQLVESAREFKTISILDASIHQIYQYWGQVLFRLNNLKEAFKVYTKLSQLEPDNRFVQDRLGEIRLALGKEYFERERATRAAQQKLRSVLVKPFAAPRGMTMIRIGLLKAAGPVELRSSTEFLIRTQDRQLLVAKGKAETTYRISAGPGTKALIASGDGENIVIEEPFVVKPARPEGTIMLLDMLFGQNNFWASRADRAYRGEMEFAVRQNSLSVVNRVGLEEYLFGVVTSEMPANWPAEALKAQIIAARSECLAKLGRHKNEGFDLCPEVHCQAYAGVGAEDARANRLVEETEGMVLEYRSKPVDALYSANCGGYSQANIFGEAEDIPYLRSQPDSLRKLDAVFPLAPDALESWLKQPPRGLVCDNPQYSRASNFRWVRIYRAEEIQQMVAQIKDIGAVRKIVVLKRNDSGHIHALKVTGSAGSCVIEKELAIRNTFGKLRSSMFKIETKYGPEGQPQYFIFYGGGWGHGVGMCQAGACGMALQGKGYRQILEHYFPQTTLKKKY